ncbi:hypothetical protein TNIN_114801 [Trichonephila inaurata madagascariensis]|uniref:Uncharacterized protein n=1 Tax=Trichonephila inaurata madagascariensis TaxID=2747483 RepID=A0A8X6XHE9_9ARAC|nr:hypothetical protein TNIN_114801 [Trichonephila inaurata madagascariensis]
MAEANKGKGKKSRKRASNSSLVPEVEEEKREKVEEQTSDPLLTPEDDEEECYETGDETSDPALRIQRMLQGIFSTVTGGQAIFPKLISKTEIERDEITRQTLAILVIFCKSWERECSTWRSEENVVLRHEKKGKDISNAENNDPDTDKKISSEARKNERQTLPERNTIDVIIEMQDEENQIMEFYAKAERKMEEEIKEMTVCGELGKTEMKKTEDNEKVQFPTEVARDTDPEMAKEKDTKVSSRDKKKRKKKSAAQLAKEWGSNKETESGSKRGSDDISVLGQSSEAAMDKLGNTNAKKAVGKDKILETQFPTEIVRDTDAEVAKEKDIKVSSRDSKKRKKKGAAQLAKERDRNKETELGGKSGSDDISVLSQNPEARLACKEDKNAETQQSEEMNRNAAPQLPKESEGNWEPMEEEMIKENLLDKFGNTNVKKAVDKDKIFETQFPTEIVRDTDAEMAKEKDVNVPSRDSKKRKKKSVAQLANEWGRNKETESAGKSGSDDISVFCQTPEAHLASEKDKNAETQQSEEMNRNVEPQLPKESEGILESLEEVMEINQLDKFGTPNVKKAVDEDKILETQFPTEIVRDTHAEMAKEKDVNVSSKDSKKREKKDATQLVKEWDRNKETESAGKSGSDDISVLCQSSEAHLAHKEDKNAETQHLEKMNRNTAPQLPKESEGNGECMEEEMIKGNLLDKFGNPNVKKAVDEDKILETQFPTEIIRDTDAEMAKEKDVNVSSKDVKERKKKGATQLAKEWDRNKETEAEGKIDSDDISVLCQSSEAHLVREEDKNTETQHSEEMNRNTEPLLPKESEGIWESLEEEVMEMYQLDKLGNPIVKKAVDEDTDAEMAKEKNVNVSSKDMKERNIKGATQWAKGWNRIKETDSEGKSGNDDKFVLSHNPEAHLSREDGKKAETQESEGDQPMKGKQGQVLDDDTPQSPRGSTEY